MINYMIVINKVLSIEQKYLAHQLETTGFQNLE